jgi:multiple sugar transport system substrate-binding protein
MNMKRWVSMFLVLLFITTIGLVGLAQDQPITISMQTYFTTPGQVAAITGAIKDYEAAHPNVTIQYYYVPFNDLVNKTLQEKMTNSLPTIVFSDNPNVIDWGQAKIFKDITSLVENWDQWQYFFPGSKAAVSYNGKIYAIQVGTNNLALAYNKTYFAQAGITNPPQTWSELLQDCAELKAVLPAGKYAIGFSAEANEEATWMFEPFLWSNGGSLLEMNKTAAVQALTLEVTLVHNGYAPMSVLQWEQTTDAAQQFANGNLAMVIAGPWEIPMFESSKGLDWAISTLPVPKLGDNVVDPMGGECFGIAYNANAEQTKVAWDFLQFLYSSQNNLKFLEASYYVPVRSNLVQDFEAAMPELNVFVKQAETAISRPVAGGISLYPQISQITMEAIQKAILGTLTPQQACDQAAQQIRALFNSDSAYQTAVDQARAALNAVGAPDTAQYSGQ